MERKSYIDYAKAICIILVVLVHIGFSALNYVILFTMPVFFAATGYTYICDKRTFKEGAVSRFKSIMPPFWYMMILYTLLEMVRAYLFGYGTATIALPSLANTIYGSAVLPFNGGIFDNLKEIMSYKAQPVSGVDLILPLNCHLWFLPAMFIGYVIFTLFAKATLKNHLIKILAIILFLLLSVSEVAVPELRQLPYGIGRGGIGAAYMLVGFWIKEYRLLEKKSRGYYLLTGAAALFIYITAILLGSDGSAFVRSVYGPYGAVSVLLTFIGGSAGVWLLFGLCRLVEYIPFERIKGFLSYIGRNVMTVYLWHMAVKFVLDAIYICGINGRSVQMLDEYKMGLMPKDSFVYMIVEAVAIFSICLFAAKMKSRKIKL